MLIIVFIMGAMLILMLGLLGALKTNTLNLPVLALIGGIIGVVFSAAAQVDGTLQIGQVYNASTSSWIVYTTNVYPSILILLIFTIVDFLIMWARIR